MISSKHLFGEKSRLFINLDLGCSSECNYCYLPSEKIQIGRNNSNNNNQISAQELHEQLCKDERFAPGPEGTLLSIGCYSETWDPRNRKNTVQLIKMLLRHGNNIQLATKRKIDSSDIKTIKEDEHWNKQLSIYISSTTLSHWKEYEKRTIPPHVRFLSFKSCADLDIPAALYIKPVLPGITVLDVNLFGELMQNHKIPCIVGDMFIENNNGMASPISKKLFIAKDDESIIIRSRLSTFGPVFPTSEEALNYIRRKQ